MGADSVEDFPDHWQAIFRSVVAIEVLIIAATFFQSQDQSFPASSGTILAWTGCHGIQLTSTFVLGWLMSMLGASIRVACYRAMGKHFTFEVTIRKDHRLVTSGPYSVVRHPSYSALCMVALGTLLCLYGSGSWLTECALKSWTGKTFALVWIAELLYPMYVAVFLRVETEDEMLKKTFGREWEEWASRTPCKLVPGLY
ncbi:hypothetical protein C8Q80DRAFT_391798 [Daedaleopsis nitida]|nr:hypothetical protein C8Q80DRAFT_391798 [Daedaleopsis nitida]